MYTRNTGPRGRILRVIIAAILTATCVRVWFAPGEYLPQAMAQIPDSGLQRQKTLTEIKHTNELLQQVLGVLRDGTIKVSMEGTDKNKKKTIVPRPSKP